MWIRSGSEIGALFMAAALLVPVDRAEMTRALELARWPHTDQERARFHGRYIVHTGGAAVNQLSVTSIEVITEFRRMELIAEAHARLNDNFARGGAIREAEQALEPWRGRLSIVAHVDASRLSFGVPDVRVDIAGRDAPPPIDRRTTPLYVESTLAGIDAEAVFSGASIGQTLRTVVVRLRDAELARAAIDFRYLD